MWRRSRGSNHRWARTKYSSPPAWLICIIGALAHAPKHSTSIRWNIPSAVSPAKTSDHRSTRTHARTHTHTARAHAHAHAVRVWLASAWTRSYKVAASPPPTPLLPLRCVRREETDDSSRRTSDGAIQSALDRIEHVVGTEDHARSCGAHLDVVLADLFAADGRAVEAVNCRAGGCTRTTRTR